MTDIDDHGLTTCGHCGTTGSQPTLSDRQLRQVADFLADLLDTAPRTVETANVARAFRGREPVDTAEPAEPIKDEEEPVVADEQELEDVVDSGPEPCRVTVRLEAVNNPSRWVATCSVHGELGRNSFLYTAKYIGREHLHVHGQSWVTARHLSDVRDVQVKEAPERFERVREWGVMHGADCAHSPGAVYAKSSERDARRSLRRWHGCMAVVVSRVPGNWEPADACEPGPATPVKDEPERFTVAEIEAAWIPILGDNPPRRILINALLARRRARDSREGEQE